MNLTFDTSHECKKSCTTCLRLENYNPDRLSEYASKNMHPLTTEQMISIVDKVKEYSQENDDELKKIIITGGEPLTNPDRVIEIAKYCKSLDLPVLLFTNGDALQEDTTLLDTLYRNGIVDIVIGVHDYENIPGLFDILETYKSIKQKKSIFNFFKQKKTELTLSFVYNNDTEQYFEEILTNISNFGIKSLKKNNITIRFYDMIPLGKDKETNDLAVKKNSPIFDTLDFYYDKLIKKTTTNIELNEMNTHTAEPSNCLHKDTITVNAFGNVGFCLSYIGPDLFGNILTDDLEEIIEKRKSLQALFEKYDEFHIPFMLAKAIALKNDGLDYAELYRPYCARILNDLFDEFNSIKDLANEFERLLSESLKNEQT